MATNSEIYELIEALCDPDKELQGDESDLNLALYDRYEIDFDNFVELVNDMINLTQGFYEMPDELAK